MRKGISKLVEFGDGNGRERENNKTLPNLSFLFVVYNYIYFVQLLVKVTSALMKRPFDCKVFVKTSK